VPKRVLNSVFLNVSVRDCVRVCACVGVSVFATVLECTSVCRGGVSVSV